MHTTALKCLLTAIQWPTRILRTKTAEIHHNLTDYSAQDTMNPGKRPLGDNENHDEDHESVQSADTCSSEDAMLSDNPAADDTYDESSTSDEDSDDLSPVAEVAETVPDVAHEEPPQRFFSYNIKDGSTAAMDADNCTVGPFDSYTNFSTVNEMKSAPLAKKNSAYAMVQVNCSPSGKPPDVCRALCVNTTDFYVLTDANSDMSAVAALDFREQDRKIRKVVITINNARAVLKELDGSTPNLYHVQLPDARDAVLGPHVDLEGRTMSPVVANRAHCNAIMVAKRKKIRPTLVTAPVAKTVPSSSSNGKSRSSKRKATNHLNREPPNAKVAHREAKDKVKRQRRHKRSQLGMLDTIARLAKDRGCAWSFTLHSPKQQPSVTPNAEPPKV